MKDLDRLVVLLISVSASLFVSISGFFFTTEIFLSPQGKKLIADWLLNVDVRAKLTNLPSEFVRVFDAVFGSERFTRRCFLRSSLASTAAAIFLFFIWWSLRPAQFRGFVSGADAAELVLFPVVFLATNLIPDYVSLLETRLFIGRLAQKPSFWRTGVILAADLACTFLIFMTVGVFLLCVVNWCRFGYYTLRDLILFGAFHDYMDASIHYPLFDPRGIGFMYLDKLRGFLGSGIRLSVDTPGISLGIFFYSTFFTSAWLWLYLLACLCARGAYRAAVLQRFLNLFLDVRDHPLRIVGLYAGVLGVGVYWLVKAMVFFF